MRSLGVERVCASRVLPVTSDLTSLDGPWGVMFATTSKHPCPFSSNSRAQFSRSSDPAPRLRGHRFLQSGVFSMPTGEMVDERGGTVEELARHAIP